MSEWKYGWKFLNGAMGTNPDDPSQEFYYQAPRPGEKWSDWTRHPDPDAWDGKDCGSGRLHVMKEPEPRYAPPDWYPWRVRYLEADSLGESHEKVGVTRLQLRRVRATVWWRTIRMGWWANLAEANLRGANLYGADLRGANLVGANLREAILYGANLYGADLYGATLVGADLSEANLRGANLRGANLVGANLYGAKLRKANLRGANLYGADLRGANLVGANLAGANLTGARVWQPGIG